MKGFQKIRGNTYILRGSPSTILYMSSENVYLIDPGHGSKRAKQIARALMEINKPVKIIVTHYHSDHLATIPKIIERIEGDIQVVAPSRDIPGIEDPSYRIAMTFGYPLELWSSLLIFDAPGVKVDEPLKEGSSIGEIETIHLPGHTPGQIAVLTPDDVLYVADSVFGDRVLSNYLLPYHRDPCAAMESLKKLYSIIEETTVMVPGHGPVVMGEDAIQLISKNENIIAGFIDEIIELTVKGASFTNLLNNIIKNRNGSAGSPSLYMLLEQSLRGALTCLGGHGMIEATIENGQLMWKSIK